MGTVITLCLVIIYSVANYGVFRFYRGERRSGFRLWQHAICPLLSSLAMLCVAFEAMYSLPPPPIHNGPVVVVVWVALGCGVLLFYRRTSKETQKKQTGTEKQETTTARPQR